MQLIDPTILNTSTKYLEKQGDRRVHLRADCSMEVVTQINGMARDTVRLTDLSKGGASLMVFPDTVIPNEFAIEGLVDEDVIHCQVAWKSDRLIGIKFIYPSLEPSSMLDLKNLQIT